MYQIKDFKNLLGLEGLSDTLLTNHFTLYEGYVNNTNKVAEKLEALLASDQGATPEYAELKRRFGWEWNGMRLHELYFENLTKHSEHPEESALSRKVIAQFGNAENWEKDFRATGAMRGIGWVILAYDMYTKKLVNVWINEHDGGHLAGTVPLLVMDVFEHAFMLDYGIKRADYIETFFKSIDWKKVNERYDALAN
ncbi:MAG: Fe-Mn family superoxide dismutase [Candidatus Moranbacteria bacterium]|nr:Fe-Mn family superoxide dismutase [Candidatus Moranbacteria bacterium]